MRYTSPNGKIWFLHKKPVQMANGVKRINYFFMKAKFEDKNGLTPCEIPPGYEIMSTKTGMPMLRKKW